MRATQDDYLITDLHCFLQAMPPKVERALVEVGGKAVSSLRIPPDQQSMPLPVSFEELIDGLGQQSSCHTEPDGWFLWSGHFATRFWSLNGQLTDNGSQMLFVGLRGDCPRSVVRHLQTLLSPDGNQDLVFQLPDLGLFVDETTFDALSRSPRSLS